MQKKAGMEEEQQPAEDPAICKFFFSHIFLKKRRNCRNQSKYRRNGTFAEASFAFRQESDDKSNCW
jgi:hypothetical protein